MRSVSTPVVFTGAAALSLTLPFLTEALGLQGSALRYACALAVGFALFGAPGWLLARAADLDRRVSSAELPAQLFVLSLGVLTPILAFPFLIGAGLTATRPAYAAVMILLTVLAARRIREAQETPANSAPLFVGVLVAIGVVVLAALAWTLTTTGSVDRWWYLAYVRGYIDAPVLGLGEPFLSREFVLPRFGFHSWLLSLALWADWAGVDPVWLYEAAAPPLLVPIAFSGLLLFANSIFGPGRTAWLTVLAGVLLATGSFFPVVTRLPEDKIFAQLILAPVVAGFFLRTVSEDGRAWRVALAGSLLALATNHALIYAFTLATLLPFAALTWMRAAVPRAATALAVAMLLLGAIYPAYSGFNARGAMKEVGAELGTKDHPVVRVHDARDRTLQFGHNAYMIAPRFLGHPLIIIGLLGIPLLARRRTRERDFLLPASVLPLVVGFVPPLATFTGHFILPWMVYRLLWIVPWAALVGVAAEAVIGRGPRLAPVVSVVLVLLAAPLSFQAMQARFQPQRFELSLPEEGPLRDVLRAISELDHDAIVAAAPELSERLPAITGKRVLAATDRATIVFSGSRSAGEARLTSRAAIMNGLWTENPALPTPTHVLFAPDSPAKRYCGIELFNKGEFRLCRFLPTPQYPWDPLPVASRTGTQSVSVHQLATKDNPEFRVTCTPSASVRPGLLIWREKEVWSARSARVTCDISIAKLPELGTPYLQAITITAFLGNAIDELWVSAQGFRDSESVWAGRAVRRTRSDEPVRFALPRSPVDRLQVEIASAFLPVVKLRDIEIGFDRKPYQQPEPPSPKQP